ncbi:4Fe-4S binding protein [Halobacteriovorax sp. GB3]|uniref:4Fe-4S binding protein n=1 Tax=Halobacteriovorax sp. GB3 TaxID=2719615 RepID=UPI00235F0C5B|nr:4Fe-4S binding protein [Halobacteriovorax sp. GB3]MDD0853519.1 4Fe-4S binding protein [Halobacteriovorax sp. GB3]
MILDKDLYQERGALAAFKETIILFFRDLFYLVTKNKRTPEFLSSLDFRGIPKKKTPLYCKDCQVCVDICPTNALELKQTNLYLDVEKCIYCQDCVDFCPDKILISSTESSFCSHGENKEFIINLDRESDEG